jgi:plasmid stabilization system protein ParE
MQSYQVVFAPSVADDLDEIVNWLSLEAPEKVPEWAGAIETHIQTLSTLPKRCPYAPENGLWGEEELRQLLFQDYPSKYRIIFTVVENSVRILNIRHSARRYLHEEEDGF